MSQATRVGIVGIPWSVRHSRSMVKRWRGVGGADAHDRKQCFLSSPLAAGTIREGERDLFNATLTTIDALVLGVSGYLYSVTILGELKI